MDSALEKRAPTRFRNECFQQQKDINNLTYNICFTLIRLLLCHLTKMRGSNGKPEIIYSHKNQV